MTGEKEYIIGMDGGGTATCVEMCRLDGSVLKRWKFGPLNINGQSYEGAAATIKELLRALQEDGFLLENCSGICAGAAGISNRDTSEVITRVLQEGGIRGKILLVGDQETALAAASEQLWGAILIAGTGSICFGKTPSGKKIRAGGYGHKIDDEGSGYAIGRDILRAVVRGEDGRQKPTVMEEAVFKMLGVTDITGLITWLYAPERKKKEIAALAVLLEQGLKQRDRAAQSILRETAMELAELAEAVLKQIPECRQLVLGGSVLLKNKEIRELFSEILSVSYPDLELISMKENAAAGAVRLLMQAMGSEDEGE